MPDFCLTSLGIFAVCVDGVVASVLANMLASSILDVVRAKAGNLSEVLAAQTFT